MILIDAPCPQPLIVIYRCVLCYVFQTIVVMDLILIDHPFSKHDISNPSIVETLV